MNFIIEIDVGGIPNSLLGPHPEAILHADAILLPSASSFGSGQSGLATYRKPVFRMWSGMAENADRELAGFFAPIPNGQADLDRISAELRVAEARFGVSDRHFKLIGVPFPDLASLADQSRPIRGCDRLHALAHDETRLKSDLASDGALTGAPFVYARAMLVAAASKLGCVPYLKPNWAEAEAECLALARQAKVDGFGGLILPSRLADLIRTM